MCLSFVYDSALLFYTSSLLSSSLPLTLYLISLLPTSPPLPLSLHSQSLFYSHFLEGWSINIHTYCISCLHHPSPFINSLSRSVIPIFLMMTTIIRVPKNSKASCHNDYRLVVLTSVIMKCFERLVMAHINSIIPDTLDPLQFSYRPNRSIDDPI